MNKAENCVIALEKDIKILSNEIERIMSFSPFWLLGSSSPDFYTTLCRFEPYAKLDYSCAHMDPASEKLFSKIYLQNDNSNIEKDIEDAVRCFPLGEQMKTLLEEKTCSRKMIAVFVKAGPLKIGPFSQKLAHIICGECVEYSQNSISSEIDVSFYFMQEKKGYRGCQSHCSPLP